MHKIKRKNDSFFRFDNLLRVFAICALLLALVVIVTQRNTPPVSFPTATAIPSTATPSPAAPTETDIQASNWEVPCTETALQTAVKQGANRYLGCDTIMLTSTLIIHQDTTFSGRETGETTLSGGNMLNTIIRIENGARLTLMDIHIADSTQFGIYLTPGSSLEIHGGIFSGHGSESGDGAAIWNENGIVGLNHVTFSDNHSRDDGAAIVNWYDGNIKIQNTIFRDNSVGIETDGTGAAIRNNGEVTIYNSLFENNSAVNSSGAAVINLSGDMLIQDSNFLSNRAGEDGAAVYNAEGATLRITGTLFRDNIAQKGGAIYNLGTLTLDAITMRDNSSDCYNAGSVTQPDNICPTNE